MVGLCKVKGTKYVAIQMHFGSMQFFNGYRKISNYLNF